MWTESDTALRQRLIGSLRRSVKRIRGRLPQYERADFTEAEWDTIRRVQPYTLTSPERLVGLVRAVDYLVNNEISGAMVECGVYRGGSMMAALLWLGRLKDTNREVYLYDTFEGMARPEPIDVDLFGHPATADFAKRDNDGEFAAWARAPLEAVKSNVRSTGYPEERLHFIEGRVEDTIPGVLPDRIALLRLDTDWYGSTKHELEHLFPRLAPSGVLIVDDYGHYRGCRKAVDDYLATLDHPILLTRMDYAARLAVKPQ